MTRVAQTFEGQEVFLLSQAIEITSAERQRSKLAVDRFKKSLGSRKTIGTKIKKKSDMNMSGSFSVPGSNY